MLTKHHVRLQARAEKNSYVFTYENELYCLFLLYTTRACGGRWYLRPFKDRSPCLSKEVSWVVGRLKDKGLL